MYVLHLIWFNMTKYLSFQTGSWTKKYIKLFQNRTYTNIISRNKNLWKNTNQIWDFATVLYFVLYILFQMETRFIEGPDKQANSIWTWVWNSVWICFYSEHIYLVINVALTVKCCCFLFLSLSNISTHYEVVEVFICFV